MAKLTISDVRHIANKGRPWTIRIECVNPATNTNKFWFATGRGIGEEVECGWGRIGAKPQLKLTSFRDFLQKINEKLQNGYDYANTPFIRMSPGNLAKVSKRTANKQKAASPIPPLGQNPTPGPCMNAIGTMTCVWCGGPVQNQCPARQPKKAAPPATKPDPKLVNTSLPVPFGLIRWLKPVKGGFEALDSNKDRLLDLPLASGTAMLRDFPTIVSILA